MVNSLAKRIVGEIAAVCTMAAKRAEVVASPRARRVPMVAPSCHRAEGRWRDPVPSEPAVPENELVTKAKLDIRDGRTPLTIPQDGTMQPMDCVDTLSNRLYVSSG